MAKYSDLEAKLLESFEKEYGYMGETRGDRRDLARLGARKYDAEEKYKVTINSFRKDNSWWYQMEPPRKVVQQVVPILPPPFKVLPETPSQTAKLFA